MAGEEPVENWYSEIKDYDFRNPGFGSNTGHFTQVVWKSSKEVGVGLATDGNTVFVVGQYNPAGNISNPGYFKDNVLPADESFKAKFLARHNEYRKKHGSPALSISEDLCSSAQAWADHLLSKREEPVENWYSEITKYDFSASQFQPGTGHFTQVVWKATTELGVGLATDGGTVFVVGQYKPAGNITNPGFFKDNVLPEEN
ncbi:hypothetical protein QTP70_004900 [Hemibagrus guttatus]|uniref:SCP domain-containing protein n=1 Tax=Hemibagrus guttatus TaxID=175788 RepID=A0AAE0QMD3_9TELE|nr:hypothetical protein QTP70_004900 [Hemibagrus guttatus]